MARKTAGAAKEQQSMRSKHSKQVVASPGVKSVVDSRSDQQKFAISSAKKHNAEAQDGDERFSKVFTDPRFRSVPKFERRIKLDKRFQSMLTDDRFKVKQSADKRGRPTGLSHSDELQRLYAADDDGDNDAEIGGEPKKSSKMTVSQTKKEKHDHTAEESNYESDGGLDHARGFGNVESSSSEDDDSDAETHRNSSKIEKHAQRMHSGIDNVLFGEEVAVDDEDDEELKWTTLDTDADRSDAVTHRLALVNQDWSRVTAKDLYVLFSSLASSVALTADAESREQQGGTVSSVKVYPSQFGLERMAEEEAMGPKELRDIAAKPKSADDTHDFGLDDDTDALSSVTKAQKELADRKVREYQVNRLKYYYAVVECDSARTANGVYEYCDGIEFEVSGCRLDLRFIPDSTTFDDVTDQLKDSFDSTMPISEHYEPKHFVTQALQQSKVQCSWDEEQVERKQRLRATRDVENDQELDEICDDGLDDILASASSSEEDGNSKIEDEEPEALPVRTNKSRLREYQQMLTELNVADSTGKNDDDEFPTKRRNKFDRNQQPYKQLDKKSISHAFGARSDEESIDDDAVDSDVDMELSWQPMQNMDEANEEDKQTRADKQRKATQRSLEKVRQKIKQRKRRGEVEESDSSDDELQDGLDSVLKRVDKKKNEEEKISCQRNGRGKKRPKIDNEDENAVGKSNKEFNVNAEDPRFGAVFTSSEYNIDVSDPKFKATKGMNKLVERKLKVAKGEKFKQNYADDRQKTSIATTENYMPDGSRKSTAENGLNQNGKEEETRRLINRLKKAGAKKVL